MKETIPCFPRFQRKNIKLPTGRRPSRGSQSRWANPWRDHGNSPHISPPQYQRCPQDSVTRAKGVTWPAEDAGWCETWVDFKNQLLLVETVKDTEILEFWRSSHLQNYVCRYIHGYPIFSQAHSQNLFLLEHQQRPEFNSTTSPGYWGPLSETTAQEFHPVAQCDQWPLLFHAVQEHILFQTHIKPSTTFVHSHGQCATHQINEIQYNNVTRVLRTPQWNHSTRVSSRRTVWSMTPVVPCSATAYPHRNPHQTLYNFCSFTWSMCDPSD